MSETNPTAVQLKAMLEGACVAILRDRAVLRAAGPDAARWLNGMTTNSVQALAPGDGVYSFFLNAQGRIQGDATIYREPTAPEADASFLILTSAAQAETLQPMLDRFIIMDDVELTTEPLHRETLLFAGARAPVLLAALGTLLNLASVPKPLRLLEPAQGTILTTPAPAPTPRFELRGPAALIGELLQSALNNGAEPASAETLETLRILEGTPLFGIDIRDRDLPQETAQPHALHFNKGCYLGQEIIERIRSRGQVHRLFTAFRLEGKLPETLPAPLEANSKPVGELTSAAVVPLSTGPALLALGYARREALDTGATLTYPGGSAHPRNPTQNWPKS